MHNQFIALPATAFPYSELLRRKRRYAHTESVQYSTAHMLYSYTYSTDAELRVRAMRVRDESSEVYSHMYSTCRCFCTLYIPYIYETDMCVACECGCVRERENIVRIIGRGLYAPANVCNASANVIN